MRIEQKSHRRSQCPNCNAPDRSDSAGYGEARALAIPAKLPSRSVIQLPPGVMETQSAGGHGGGPFVRVTTDKGSLIGFRCAMGNWAGSDCLRDLQPIYADFGSKRLKITGNNPQEIVAKPG